MDKEEIAKRRVEAAEEFNQHERRDDGARVAGRLADGLTVLRESLYSRVHDDVQRIVGRDSMLMPVSEKKSEAVAKTEIEIFQIAVSTATGAEAGYVTTDNDWYLRWLARLRLGEMHADEKVIRRLEHYLSKTSGDRRLAFTDVMASALPESRRAPLVLFRLLPSAVQIVTAQAFDDDSSALQARSSQANDLPAVRDCPKCNGSLLDSGRQCPECGNPLWRFTWLTTAD